MPEIALKFNSAYEQVKHFIQHFGLSSGSLGAGGMGYEFSCFLSPKTPEWANDCKYSIITQLGMINNYHGFESFDLSVKMVGRKVHLKAWLDSGCESQEICKYPQLHDEILHFLGLPKGAHLAESNDWEPYWWSNGQWDSICFYTPEFNDYDHVRLNKALSKKLAQLIKRYAPHKELYRSITALKLYNYKHRGCMTIESGITKWIDITDTLLKERPY